MTIREIAAALLPVLLVLYPLSLLLDDLEPGFVRSVVNPHWFLVAMIVAGIVAGKDLDTNVPTPSPAKGGQALPSRWEGEKLKVMFALAAAIVAGLWVWWRLQAGMLGIVVALLAAIAVWIATSVSGDTDTPS